MFKILIKELQAFLKDRRAVLFTFLLPTILISVFALAFGVENNNGRRKISLLVCDEDRSAITQKTISDIDSVKMLEVIPCSYDSAINLIKAGKKTSVLVFKKGFSDSVKALRPLPWEFEYDAARAQETGILESLLTRTLYGNVGRILARDAILKNITALLPFTDSSARKNLFFQVAKNFEMGNSGLNTTVQNIIKLNVVSLISAKVGSVGLIQAVAGTAVMMLLFSLTGMGGGLLDEKEQGTLKRLLYSPVHPAGILLGKMAASIVVAIAQLVFMFAFALIVFHLHIMTKIVPLAILIFATAFACSGFGIFLATLARSRQQLQGISTLVIISMSVIGGSMVPTFIMPQWMQNISVVSINYWSIQGFYDILWRQIPIGLIFLEKVGVLLAIGIVLTLLSFRFFKKNVIALE